MLLIGLKVSPYSERAKWALDHHQLRYRYHEHVVLLEEPYLIWKSGSFSKATVPMLLTHDGVVTDSYQIAKYSDARGGGSLLFPLESRAEIERIHQLSEQTVDLERRLFMGKLLSDPDAQLEQFPWKLPVWLQKVMRPVVLTGVKFIAWSFSVQPETRVRDRQQLRVQLEELRTLLKKGGKEYLLGQFTFADITAAAMIHFFTPPEPQFFRCGPATRKIMTDPELALEFRDLVEWRDQLYHRHRRQGNQEVPQ